MCHFILNTDKEENLLRCLTDISSRFFLYGGGFGVE